MATAGSSQYYISRTQPIRPTLSPKYEQEWAETLPDDSVYIFPNPPSSRGSPTQHSDLSVLTDFAFSGLSEPKSPVDYGNGSHISNRLPLTPLTPSEGIGQIEWTQSDANDILLGIRDRADQWREVIARRRAIESHFDTSGASHQPTSSVGENSLRNRQPCLQLPFLSFITSLLSVDDATFQLLSHGSSCSALFPGQTRLSNPNPNDDEEGVGFHGLEKLLLRTSESRVIIEGCAVVSDPSTPYVPFSPLPLVDLWGMVASLVINGSKAVREVLRGS